MGDDQIFERKETYLPPMDTSRSVTVFFTGADAWNHTLCPVQQMGQVYLQERLIHEGYSAEKVRSNGHQTGARFSAGKEFC